MNSKPDIIIACGSGALVKYILTHKPDAKQRRLPVYTADVDKAKRFYTGQEASIYYSHFPKDGKPYRFETFKPARV